MMASELDIGSDFAAVIDGLEPITLARRAAPETIAVPQAWRFASRVDEAESAGGHIARHDVVWQFAWDEANDLPRVGDSILDAGGQCWSILAVQQLRARTRLRCETRNLRLVYQLDNRVDIEQAVWEEGESGPEIVGWETVRTAVPARIQPDRLSVDHGSAPPVSTATYRVILGERLELTGDCRFIDPQGAAYRLVEYRQAERIDVLPVAVVVRM